MVRNSGVDAADPVDSSLAALVRSHGVRSVLDVGGGSGTHAVPLARRGCRVTVVDTSADALAILRRRAVDADVSELITGVQADADASMDVVAPGTVDLVLGHHVLEQLADPAGAVARMAVAARPGGFVSVVVPGRLSAALHRGAAGRFDQATAILTSPSGTSGAGDEVGRRFEPADLEDLFATAGLEVESIRGWGVLDGLWGVPARAHAEEPDAAAAGRSFDHLLAAHPTLSAVAASLHGIARRSPAE